MYQVKIIAAAQKDLNELPTKVLNQIGLKINELTANPRPHGSIKLTQEEGYRFRVGKYRILYRIDDKEKEIFIYRVKHRKEAYR